MWLETSRKWIFACLHNQIIQDLIAWSSRISHVSEQKDTWVSSKPGRDTRYICFLIGRFCQDWDFSGGLARLQGDLGDNWGLQEFGRQKETLGGPKHCRETLLQYSCTKYCWDAHACDTATTLNKSKQVAHGIKKKLSTTIPTVRVGLFCFNQALNSLNPPPTSCCFDCNSSETPVCFTSRAPGAQPALCYELQEASSACRTVQ